MADDILPVSADELAAALAHGLTREGRKAWRRADDIMSTIVAGELADALDAAGFVIMRKPPLEAHGRHLGPAKEPRARSDQT